MAPATKENSKQNGLLSPEHILIKGSGFIINEIFHDDI